MSQFDFGNLESPLPGTTLINSNIEPWRDALHSLHSGDERPSYAVAGMMWIDNTNANWDLNVFDGSEDIKIGTIDTTNNLFIPENVGDWAGTAAGSANALTLTPTPAIAALTAGMVFDFIVNSTNTNASPTMAISGLDPETIKTNLGAGKVGAPKGSLVAGTAVRILWDGTDFVLMNPRPHNIATSIATAATLNLNAATGDYVTLTGTTNVSAITLVEGQERTCRASGVFDLVNSASLILPSGADITTAAGDVFIVRGEASGVVRLVNYMRADGTAIVGGGGIELGTEVATTSGTAFDFTSIPAGTNRITVLFDRVSLNGTNDFLIQIGDGGSPQTSGYDSRFTDTNGTTITSTAGFVARNANASYLHTGQFVITRMAGNKWNCAGVVEDNAKAGISTGVVTLSGELDMLRITRSATNTFDNGAINIIYE